MTAAEIEYYKKTYPPGTRIRLNRMQNDPFPIPEGTTGTVDHVDDVGTLHCKFDDGRFLGVIPGEDSFSVITQEESPEEENEISL